MPEPYTYLMFIASRAWPHLRLIVWAIIGLFAIRELRMWCVAWVRQRGDGR